MSWDKCKYCGYLVDTDLDPDCYYDDNMNETPCTCEMCRERGEEL